MSSLTKLTTTSLVHFWPVVNLTSAGSHGKLKLNVRVGAGVSAVRRSLERLFLSIPTTSPPSLFFSFILHSTDLISVDGCLEWRLMAGLQGFASHGGCILSGGWLDTVEVPGYYTKNGRLIPTAKREEITQP